MNINDKEKLALKVIDTWLDYRSRYSDFPGFQVCIRKEGKVLFSKAYGYANLLTKRPLTTKDLFHIASHSKTFTSCAVLQLVEQGKLNLHQSVLDYLPEFKNHKDKRFKQITVRDLLSNRSGLFRDGIDSEFWDLQKPFPSKDKLIEDVLSSHLIYAPNECTKYSNMGFSLLGLILEKVLRMPYQNVIETLILKKLKDLHTLTDYSDQQKNMFADGHSRPFLEQKRLPFKHVPTFALAPATGLCGNAEETSRFFETLLLGKGLLKQETQKELLSLNWSVKNTSQERYGLGLQFDRFPDRDLVGHNGSYPGFSSSTTHALGTKYVVSFLLNTNEIMPMRAVRSIIQIFSKVDSTFTSEEAKQAITGGPLMNKWRGLVFILTKKKGLGFSLENWAPNDEVMVLSSQNGEEYLCDNLTGYASIGESFTFTKDKDGNILSAKLGSYPYLFEKTFLNNLKETLLMPPQ
ncbi:MAG: beta-lactamase family protein [Alphaproteobacteria bacterium]|nr:beta-lactamase family protein [Alphaproteobacteria bacterium]